MPALKYKNTVLIIIILVMAGLVMLIVKNPPQSKRGKPSSAAQMTVQTMTISPESYQVKVQSYGTVQPRTQSVLFAQVSGQIMHVSPQFRDGGFFEQGDILIQLDDRDHKAEVNIAQASLLSAKQALLEEEARSRQAEIDWKRLGNGRAATALVLRKPQLESAKARLLSSQAQYNKAKLALERTQIIAPYAGRILKKHVDIGQVVSSNTSLANIYAIDYVEIRLPIKNKDLPLINFPEEYRDAGVIGEKNDVLLTSSLLGEHSWHGQVIRTESAIDENSQQLYVVAQILKPYDAQDNQGAQLKIGQYVTASITGKTLEEAIVIPSKSIYQGSYVYIVEGGVLKRKEVTMGWQNGHDAIVLSGLNINDKLVLTPLGQVNSGTPVAISGEENHNSLHKEQSDKGGDMSPERKARMEKRAQELGITVEALIERKKARQAGEKL